jgi:serine/threonine protein kinase
MTMADKPLLLGGRYELADIVGRGDIAEVFRARDIRLDRVVAVKTLRDDIARKAKFQARFRREAQSVASLNHPSIVAIYDTGEDKSGPSQIPYIVMEYVDGRTLRDLLRDDRRLLPVRALAITDGVLRALDHGHRAGILHRDIKPGNVMLARSAEVKVMNFGRTRSVFDKDIATTDLQLRVGFAYYLSPELARGERADARSDLYSTGCLLYELLTARPPFLGDSAVAIAYQHAREDPVPPSRLDAEIPRSVDFIVLRAMDKDPAQRYQSAAEMRADIQRALSAMPIATSAYPVAPEVLRRIYQRRSTRPPGFEPMVPPDPAPRIGLYTKDTLLPGSAPKVQPDSAAPAVPGPSSIVLKRPTLVRVSEAPTRRSEPIGSEVRSFNNANSSSTSLERISVSHETDVSVSMDLTKTRALSGSAGLSFIDVVSAQASLGNDLARHYSLRMDAKLTSEQSTEVNIPAHTHVKIIFHWYRVRATGMLTIAEQARRPVEIAEVPFEITIGLFFDKESMDINEPERGSGSHRS